MSLNVELARHNMIEQQVRPWEVLDSRVLEALSAVRRENFVPPAYRNLAFADMCLPLGHDEVMMKPVVEGRVLQAVAPTRADSVLEIGTGSGFVTACLARLAREVVSVELRPDFADSARARLHTAGVRNATVTVADAVTGFDSKAAFDIVVVTGAVYALPERFRHRVAPGGRLFAIVGESPAMSATLFTRVDQAHWTQERLFETDLAYLTNAAPPKRFAL